MYICVNLQDKGNAVGVEIDFAVENGFVVKIG